MIKEHCAEVFYVYVCICCVCVLLATDAVEAYGKDVVATAGYAMMASMCAITAPFTHSRTHTHTRAYTVRDIADMSNPKTHP